MEDGVGGLEGRIQEVGIRARPAVRRRTMPLSISGTRPTRSRCRSRARLPAATALSMRRRTRSSSRSSASPSSTRSDGTASMIGSTGSAGVGLEPDHTPGRSAICRQPSMVKRGAQDFPSSTMARARSWAPGRLRGGKIWPMAIGPRAGSGRWRRTSFSEEGLGPCDRQPRAVVDRPTSESTAATVGGRSSATSSASSATLAAGALPSIARATEPTPQASFCDRPRLVPAVGVDPTLAVLLDLCQPGHAAASSVSSTQVTVDAAAAAC